MIALGALELLAQPRVQVAIIVQAREVIVQAQLLEARARLDHVVVQPLDAQHGFDARHELVFVEGFAHVVVGADLEPFHAAGAVGFDGHQQHRQEGIAGHALQQPASFEPGKSRHQDVEQHQVDPALGHALDRHLTVGHGVHDEAVFAQHAGEQLARDAIIVGDDDRRALQRSLHSAGRGRLFAVRHDAKEVTRIARERRT